MLALVLAALSAVAGLLAGGSGEAGCDDGSATQATVVLAEPCCATATDGLSTPCLPGDSCPPAGGCTCVGSSKRIAECSPALGAPVVTSGAARRPVSPEGPPGTEDEDAVWHPPRG